jgi:hypothetical protein
MRFLRWLANLWIGNDIKAALEYLMTGRVHQESDEEVEAET